MILVLLTGAGLTGIAAAQEMTTVIPVDAWHSGCVPMRNYAGVWTEDWAYSGGDGYPQIGTWTTSVVFADRIPSDRLVTSVTLQLHGGLNYGTNTLSPRLNGTSLGTLGPYTGYSFGYQTAYCIPNNATQQLGWRWDFPIQRYDGGFPGYVSGGTNTFEVGWTTQYEQLHGGRGKLTLEKADLIVTHIPLAVFFDVNGDFTPTNRTDDLPRWVPGSSLTGAPVSPAATPLQTVSIHVITPPRVRGTIQAELVDVSRFPGKAMNYPVASTDVSPDLYFDNFSLTKQVTIQSSSSEADTVLQLRVNDYAARGILRLTIPNGTRTATVVYKRLPISTSPSMLPDAGWYAQTTQVNPSAIVNAADDSDTTPAGPTEIGDGYGAFEEYRGFVVQGTHTRLDPGRRDLFVHADTGIDTSLFGWLPFNIHYIGSGEAKTENLGRHGIAAAIQGTWPEMNPNRDVAGGTIVPVARTDGQHGLRVILTRGQDSNYPDWTDQAGQTYPAWQLGVLGVAWQRQQTCANWSCTPNAARVEVNLVDQGATLPYPSLNGMSFVEIFDRGSYRGNLYIQGASGFAAPPVQYLDDGNQTVPPCNASGQPSNCDYYDLTNMTVRFNLYPYGRFILHSRLSFFDDFYTKVSQDCTNANPRLLTSAEFAQLPALVTLHETTHGLGVSHNSICGSLMFDAAGHRMPDVYQYPTAFDATELAGMRTH